MIDDSDFIFAQSLRGKKCFCWCHTNTLGTILRRFPLHNVDRQARPRNPKKKCWTGVMFEGLGTLIPFSNNLTLLLRLTSSSPGSGLQKNFFRTFFLKFDKSLNSLISSVYWLALKGLLAKKKNFILNQRNETSVLWNPLKRRALISSDKHQDTKNKQILLPHPEGSIWYLPLSILVIEMINFKKLEESMWQSMTDKCLLWGRVPSDATYHNMINDKWPLLRTWRKVIRWKNVAVNDW